MKRRHFVKTSILGSLAIGLGNFSKKDKTHINPIPSSSKPVRLGCWSFGPDNADNWVEKQVNEFLATTGGWLILNLHGLDNVGWGPITSKYLNGLLQRLVKIEYLD